jgi:signal transduction histidine kinase
MGLRILVADDDADIRTVLSDRLRHLGHAVVQASDGMAALDALNQQLPDLVFLDIEMPKVKGPEVLQHIRRTWPDLPVIIMTAYGSIALAVQAMKDGANDFIAKPLEFQNLPATIHKAMERKALTGEIAKLLGDISHDVKNLLMPVVSGTDILELELSDLFKQLPEIEHLKAEESHKVCDEVLSMLRTTAQRLQERTKQIADFVKTQSAPPQFLPCQLKTAADSVVTALRLPAERKGVTLVAKGLQDLPSFEADERRLFGALYNLVHNAIAAVPDGGWVKIAGRYDQEAKAVVVTVEDTGCGMPPDVREALFTAKNTSRKAGGTGLGMKIVKDAVDVHEGRITVESTEGKGTTVQIVLPIRRAVEPS